MTALLWSVCVQWAFVICSLQRVEFVCQRDAGKGEINGKVIECQDFEGKFVLRAWKEKDSHNAREGKR